MPSKKSTPTKNNENSSLELVRMYYEHQYDRMAELEQHRLAITNIVISLSLLAFTFGFTDINNLSLINGVGLPLLVIFSNMFAISYVNQANRFMDVHGKRARKILEVYAQELNKINLSIPWPKPGKFGGRTRLQTLLHALLIIIAFLPITIYVINL